MANVYQNTLTLRFKTDFVQKIYLQLFASFDEAIQKRIDALVQQQYQIVYNNRPSEDTDVKVVGYKLEDKTFLHSNVIGVVNLSYMQLLSDRLPSLDPSLLTEGMEILKLQNKKEHDLMRFKAMLNGFMSVCKNVADFVVVFSPLFENETREYLSELGMGGVFPTTAKQHTTLQSYDNTFVEDTKERFTTEYNRYKFLKTIIGV